MLAEGFARFIQRPAILICYRPVPTGGPAHDLWATLVLRCFRSHLQAVVVCAKFEIHRSAVQDIC